MFFRLFLVVLLAFCFHQDAWAEWRHKAPSATISHIEQQERPSSSTAAKGNSSSELASFAFLFLLLSLLVGFTGLSNPFLGLSLAATFGLFWLTIALLNYPEEHAFPAMPMLMFMLSVLLAVLVLIRPWYAIIGVGGFFLLLLFIGLIMQAASN